MIPYWLAFGWTSRFGAGPVIVGAFNRPLLTNFPRRGRVGQRP